MQWEARLIRDAFYREQGASDRFLPVVLPGQSVAGVPDFLAPASSTVYKLSEITVAGTGALLRLLTGQPEEIEPPLGRPPRLPARDHRPAPPAPLRHEVAVRIEPGESGLCTRTLLAGTLLGERTAPLPPGLAGCWSELDSPTGADRLAGLGQEPWTALFDEDGCGRWSRTSPSAPSSSWSYTWRTSWPSCPSSCCGHPAGRCWPPPPGCASPGG